MDLYPSNSDVSKKSKAIQQETLNDIPKSTGAVVSGATHITKRSLGSKIIHLLRPNDISQALDSIVTDSIVPNIKSALVNIITNAAYTLAYGSTPPTGKGGVPAARIDYHKRYDSVGSAIYTPPSKVEYRPAEPVFDYDDLSYETRADAESVLATMRAYIDEYGSVRVFHMIDFSGITPRSTDMKRGWTSLLDAHTVAGPDGRFRIVGLPKPMPIE